MTTYPMPGPPSNEECTCYERVIPADAPCGSTEGAIETVTPLSCPFHSWRVSSRKSGVSAYSDNKYMIDKILTDKLEKEVGF